MIDHIGIDVKDYEKSKAFYAAALTPLGYELIMEVMGWAGFGAGGKDNGPPGIRAIYHPNYYGAFVFDPE